MGLHVTGFGARVLFRLTVGSERHPYPRGEARQKLHVDA